MKAVILAGGFGTRISEETHLKPKPMVEIGGKPILWHIMKIYSHYGIHEFIICLGYKGNIIKEFFDKYSLYMSDVTIDLSNQKATIHQNYAEPWKITLIDTGEHTMTGGRLKRVIPYVNNETFCFTYGDGLADINITELINFHKKQKRWATITAVQPPGRFGALKILNERIVNFDEKPKGDQGWINGGFFVLEPEVFSLINDDSTVWEKEPLEQLAKMGQLSAYKHNGFWQPMDTLRDKNKLEEYWVNGKAEWKCWE